MIPTVSVDVEKVLAWEEDTGLEVDEDMDEEGAEAVDETPAPRQNSLSYIHSERIITIQNFKR
jgi:hypothetical protein